ncbi:MAG: hypothetical protein WCP58_09705, partial [bacterium]
RSLWPLGYLATKLDYSKAIAGGARIEPPGWNDPGGRSSICSPHPKAFAWRADDGYNRDCDFTFMKESAINEKLS